MQRYVIRVGCVDRWGGGRRQRRSAGVGDACKLKSVSMGNAIKYVKMQITHIPADISDAEVCY